MLKICDECQQLVDSEDNFCRHCGAELFPYMDKIDLKNNAMSDLKKSIEELDPLSANLKEIMLDKGYDEITLKKLEVYLKSEEDISVSLIQRLLSIGFVKASILFDILLKCEYIVAKEENEEPSIKKYFVNKDKIDKLNLT